MFADSNSIFFYQRKALRTERSGLGYVEKSLHFARRGSKRLIKKLWWKKTFIEDDYRKNFFNPYNYKLWFYLKNEKKKNIHVGLRGYCNIAIKNICLLTLSTKLKMGHRTTITQRKPFTGIFFLFLTHDWNGN